MRPFFRLIQIEACPPRHNLLLMLEVFLQHLLEVQHSRLAVHQRKHDCTKGILKLCIFIKLVQYNVCVCVLFQVDDDADIITRRRIVHVADALHALLPHKLVNLFN